MANTIKLIHMGCGHVLGNFNSDEDHGSFEMECPECKEWVEIFNGLLSTPPGDGLYGSVIYKDITPPDEQPDMGDCADPECPHNEAPSGD